MPGRNDPCPCGSGKKYKKCCGAKDKAEQQANHIVVNKQPVTESIQNERVETNLPPLFNPPKSVPELDPLREQFDTFWEAFEDASYEESWQLLDDLLVNQPELLDGELIFETGNMLFGQAVEKDDVERFSRFLDQIETVAPRSIPVRTGLRIGLAYSDGFAGERSCCCETLFLPIFAARW